MNILHIAMNYQGHRQPAMERMLQSLGTYRQFDWIAENGGSVKCKSGALDNKLLKFCEADPPDLVFAQIHESAPFSPKVISSLPGFKINYCEDVRNIVPPQYILLANACTVTCFSNMRDVHTMRKLGFTADYLKVGFNEKIYFPRSIEKIPGKVTFMGNDFGRLFPLGAFRKQFVHKMRRHFPGFQVFGNGFPKAKKLNFQFESEAMEYAQSEIAFNISHYQIERYTSDRLFRLMGSGAFCLSHHYPGIEEEFELGKHLITFSTIKEAIELTHFYLNNAEARNQIQQVGTRHVHEHHTWQARASEVKRIISTHTSPSTTAQIHLHTASGAQHR